MQISQALQASSLDPDFSLKKLEIFAFFFVARNISMISCLIAGRKILFHALFLCFVPINICLAVIGEVDLVFVALPFV